MPERSIPTLIVIAIVFMITGQIMIYIGRTGYENEIERRISALEKKVK